jgi:hypothetical protein
MPNHIMANHSYQVPRSLLPLLKKEVKRLCEIGVLRKTNNLEWAAQGFAVPKKNKQIQFVTDFLMAAEPIPMPIPISATFDSRNFAYS